MEVEVQAAGSAAVDLEGEHIDLAGREGSGQYATMHDKGRA